MAGGQPPIAKAKIKRNDVPVHAMKTQAYRTHVPPVLLNLGTRWRLVGTIMSRSLYTPDKNLLYQLHVRLGGPGLGLDVLVKKKKSVTPVGIRTPGIPAHSLVRVQTPD
jgi:hypothetical protein